MRAKLYKVSVYYFLFFPIALFGTVLSFPSYLSSVLPLPVALIVWGAVTILASIYAFFLPFAIIILVIGKGGAAIDTNTLAQTNK